jgi:hypothetical protein
MSIFLRVLLLSATIIAVADNVDIMGVAHSATEDLGLEGFEPDREKVKKVSYAVVGQNVLHGQRDESSIHTRFNRDFPTRVVASRLTKRNLQSFASILENRSYSAVDMHWCSIAEIPTSFFEETAVEIVVFSPAVQKIGESAFRNCNKLKSISLPGGVAILEEGAFYDCRSLCHIHLPHSVRKLGDMVFAGCTNLPVVDLRSAVEFGEQVCVGCPNLERLVLSSNFDLRNIPDGDNLSRARFSGLSVGANAFYGIPLKCTTVIRAQSPHEVDTDLEFKVFLDQRMRAVRNYDPNKTYTGGWVCEVDDPNYSGDVSDNAFSANLSLKSVRLPNARSIGMFAFDGCFNLMLVDISRALFVHQGAFFYCTSLKDLCMLYTVQFEWDMLPRTFVGCMRLSNISLVVPAHALSRHDDYLESLQKKDRSGRYGFYGFFPGLPEHIESSVRLVY